MNFVLRGVLKRRIRLHGGFFQATEDRFSVTQAESRVQVTCYVPNLFSTSPALESIRCQLYRAMEEDVCIAPILLCIIDYVALQTLLSLRLVSRSINSFISSYESSIAMSVIKNLCPSCDEHTWAAYTPSTLTDLIYFVRLDTVHDPATKAVACTQLSRKRHVLHHARTMILAIRFGTRYNKA